MVQVLNQLQEAGTRKCAKLKQHVNSILQDAKEFQHEHGNPLVGTDKNNNFWLDTQKDKEDQARQLVKRFGRFNAPRRVGC